jgi:hypothetical protein
MTTTPLPDLVLYTRPGCGLCDEARTMLAALLADRSSRGLPTTRVVERNIELDPALEREFFEVIPVIESGERRLTLVTSLGTLRHFLRDVLDAAPAEAR